MKFEIRSEAENTQLIQLDGALDFSSSPDMRRKLSELAEKKPSKVLIDLKKVTYLDSSGLAIFVELFQKMRRYNGKLVFFNIPQSVRNVFEVAKLESVFQLVKTREEALALFA
jgi:anti-sigma B factor antagonist